jgi:hypothetical protein
MKTIAAVALAFTLVACGADQSVRSDSTRIAVLTHDRCQELATMRQAHLLAPDILKQTGNVGNNVNAQVRDCRYFAKEDAAMLSVELFWTGPLTGVSYALAGRLTLEDDRWQWETTGKSAELRELEAGIAAAGLILRALGQ